MTVSLLDARWQVGQAARQHHQQKGWFAFGACWWQCDCNGGSVLLHCKFARMQKAALPAARQAGLLKCTAAVMLRQCSTCMAC